VHGYVLHDFGKEERTRMDKLTDAMAEAFPLLAKGDGVGFMNKVSLLVPASDNDVEEKAGKTANGKE
jgi:peptidyl-tRNA hydrolase